MIWTNFKIAAILFFGWLMLDSFFSVALSSPLDGVYYPAASGTLKSLPGDWTARPRLMPLIYLVLISAVWIFFIKKEGKVKGMRLAAFVTAFVMAPFWIVTAVSADMYNLSINGYWLASMIYSNIIFVIFFFFGKGNIEDMYI